MLVVVGYATWRPEDDDGDGYADIPRAFPASLALPRLPPPALRGGQPDVDPQPFVAAVSRPWRRAFLRAGLRWTAPRWTFYSGSDARVCGGRSGSEAVAIYCPGERRIHFERESAALMSPGDFWLVVAHEVGHHVQELRGTLSATGSRVLDRPVDASPLHIREELQAECYAGVWAYSARGRAPNPEFFFRVGYKPGRATQTRRWFERGLRSGRPGLCDTFSPRDP